MNQSERGISVLCIQWNLTFLCVRAACADILLNMDIPSHLRQPLCIDTNIAYSLDFSRFPGLDDPQHKNQPALLIASSSSFVDTSKMALSVTSSVPFEDDGAVELIPSPTQDTTDTADDLLQDLLSIIGK